VITPGSAAGTRRILLAGLAAMVAVGASGCVSLQASGPVTSVTEEGEGSSQVQIWPSPPSAGEHADAIVSGFLEAAHSGSANLAIADDYLTSDMQKQWKTEQNTVIVLADGSESYPQPPGGSAAVSGDSGDAASSVVTRDNAQQAPLDGVDTDSNTSTGTSAATATEDVQGDLLGTLDSSGLYSASNGTATYDFELVDTKAGFRISSLPPDFGVLMERSDFESAYDRHDVYYENAQYQDKLIPTQVYLPGIDTDQDLADAMARLVVDGVPGQLGSALQTAVPDAVFKSVQFGGDGDATVTISSKGACVKSPADCTFLGQQLADTLSSLSTKVTSVTIDDQANGEDYQSVSADGTLVDYGLSQGGRLNRPFYAVTAVGGVEQVSIFGTASANATSFGSSSTKFKSIAVGPSEQVGAVQSIALVSQDGTKVYVPHKQNGSYALTQVYPPTSNSSTNSSASGSSVGELSWDDYGDLWFTVKIADGVTNVYRYGLNGGDLSEVALTGLDGQVTQVAAAPDGVRVAVGYKDSSGDGWISVAAASSDSDGNWSLQLGDPEVAAADWDQVNSFDWYNEDSLAVLGIQPNSQVLGLYQVYADGSAVYDSLTEQPVEASPPANVDHFVWNSAGDPIASALNGGKERLYELSVEGADAQDLSGIFGTSPSY